MIARVTFLIVLGYALSAGAQAPANCPWFTTGSAANVLGGPVTVTAHSDGNWNGSCRFVHQSGTSTETIEIEVTKTNPHACPDGSTKLKALGNEASQCRRSTAQGAAADTITGRVRDAYFTVTMINVAGATDDASRERPDDAYGASILERVAEQVAGNLY